MSPGPAEELQLCQQGQLSVLNAGVFEHIGIGAHLFAFLRHETGSTELKLRVTVVQVCHLAHRRIIP